MVEPYEGKILVIGLGQIGYTCSQYLKQNGLSVDGYDISEAAQKRATDAGIIDGIAKDFSNYDCYVIAISTHKPENEFVPYLDSFYKLIEDIAKQGKQDALITIESTIPYGTTEKVLEIVKHKMHVLHVPHRYYSKESDTHGVNQLRVLGASHNCCAQIGEYFYHKVLGIPIHKVSSSEVAELSKVIENTYRYLQIAFAEELKVVCDSKGIDFSELREACNTKWNIDILENQKGIGGHCLPKDTQMFLDFSSGVLPKSLLETAMAVDLNYRAHLIKPPLLKKN